MNFISGNSSDQKKLLSATKKLLNPTDEVPYPFNDKLKLANEMGSYFIERFINVQVKLDNMASGLSARPSSSNNCPYSFTIMDRFSPTV